MLFQVNLKEEYYYKKSGLFFVVRFKNYKMKSLFLITALLCSISFAAQSDNIVDQKIYVNGKLYNEYFADEIHKMQITRPFEIINQATDYDVRCSVKGGGPTGQAGAMVHGISKALVLFDENLKTTLKILVPEVFQNKTHLVA